MEERWNEEPGIEINDEAWKTISAHAHKIHDNSFLWFEMKLIYRILGIKAYLNKISILGYSERLYLIYLSIAHLHICTVDFEGLIERQIKLLTCLDNKEIKLNTAGKYCG